MFKVEGTTITISKGDTGALKITANATIRGSEEPYQFGPDDRALFTIKSGNGQIVKQQAYAMSENVFYVHFLNSDTDQFAAGGYTWDVRYVINPYYDGRGNIVDGDQVLTPNMPMNANILSVVGEI